MKYDLVTFADKKLARAAKRVKKQAQSMGCFENIFTFNEDDLSLEFRIKYQDYLCSDVRGYGYWCWKPECIKMALDVIQEGNFLLYIDAGCHLNKKGLIRLKEYFNLLSQAPNGILAFQAITPTPENSKLKYDGRKLFEQFNYQWIKGDLLENFGVKNNPTYTHAEAIGAGIILVKKCADSQQIINEWSSVIETNFSLIDDTPSSSPNICGFIEHRHDQAIFSLLCIKYKVQTISAYEYWYPKIGKSSRMRPDWRALKEFPIHAKRDKGNDKIFRFALRKAHAWIKKILSVK